MDASVVHWTAEVDKEPSEPKRKRRHCTHSQHKKCTQTTWFCRECGVFLCHIGDSHIDCFLKWHKDRLSLLENTLVENAAEEEGE